jgi:hypothetical protein
MTIRSLKLAKDLSLPVDVVTQTLAVLAKRRAGKSYTMRRLVEQLHHAGQQIVLVDPKGDQWGLRSASDGKAPGLPFVILGGERADVPLEVGAGEVVAKLVVEERVSVVLDLSLFRKHEVATFMTAFMENLYRLKAREQYRTPMMLVVDEADAIAPQKPQKGEERMLGAIEDIVRRGGQRGIGCVLVSQRSAVLNKNVLTQAQILVVLRTIAPQDLAAMKAWVDVHGTDEEAAELMASLPSLPVGDAWVWSPGWPTADGIFQRVHVLPIETFDSGATPKPGEQRREPKQVADVDLDALKRQMAATIEKAKADDPRELRKQIAELRQQVAKLSEPGQSVPTGTKTVEKFVLTDGDRAVLEKLAGRLLEVSGYVSKIREQTIEDVGELFARLRDTLGQDESTAQHGFLKQLDSRGFQKILAKLSAVSCQQTTPTTTTSAPRSPLPRRVAPPAPATSARPARQVSDGDVRLNRLAERKVLQVLAQHGPRTKQQLAIQAGYASSGGGFNGALSKLKGAGYIVVNGNGIEITGPGTAAIGTVDPLPTGAALVAYWMQQFNRLAEREVLRVVVEAYPQSLSLEDVAARTNPPYEPKGGGFNGAVSKLRTLGLVEGRGELRASAELFD